ncbi:MAG: NADH-quinone oxidoreductase subunit A [Deltaproteobacteria bacterium]|nr:NADH-quinone oxidoreductase subunit A [Deltaproteobacteria bacterium]
MTDPYLGLVILFLLSVFSLLVLLGLASWLGPKNPTPTKQIPFECGSVSVGEAKSLRFNVQFYLVAVLFLLFDVEVLFLYPWSVNVRELGWTGYMDMLVFVVVLALGLIYAWRKGVLDWNKSA